MCIKIKKISDTEININGKKATSDMNGNWIAQEQMTSAEVQCGQEFIEALKRCRKIEKATYTL